MIRLLMVVSETVTTGAKYLKDGAVVCVLPRVLMRWPSADTGAGLRKERGHC